MDQTRQHDGNVYDFIMERMNAGEERASIVQELIELGYSDIDAENAVIEVEGVIAKAIREAPTGQTYLSASIGALFAAIVGGVLWGAISIISNYELGIVAWGIGGLCGYAVLLITQGRRGTILQIIAAAASIIGILFGKYVAFVAAFRDLLGADYKNLFSFVSTLFDSKVFNIFMQEFHVMVQPYDLLWLGLAVVTAWKILQAMNVAIPRGYQFSADR